MRIPYSGTIPDLLTQPDIASLVVFRVGGIPVLLGSGPLPSEWDVGGGRCMWEGVGDYNENYSYKWLPRLQVNNLKGSSQTAEPKAGLGVTGSMNITCWLYGTDNSKEDELLTWIHPSLAKSGGVINKLTATLSIEDTGPMYVDNGLAFNGFDTLYLNTETMWFGGPLTKSSIDGLERGLYGSTPRTHLSRAADSSLQGSEGPLLASYPLVWEGRWCEVWMCFGMVVDGEFVPYYDPNTDYPIRQSIFAGVLADVSETPTSVEFQIAGLESVFNWQVPTEVPTMKVFGFDPADRQWVMNRYVNQLHMTWNFGDSSTHSSMAMFTGVFYQNYYGAVSTDGITYLPTLSDSVLRALILYQLQNVYQNQFKAVGGGYHTIEALNLQYDSYLQRYVLTLQFQSDVSDCSVTFHVDGRENSPKKTSLLQYFGFTQDFTLNFYSVVGQEGYTASATANDPPISLIIPPHSFAAPFQLAVWKDQQSTALLPYESVGWTDHQNNPIPVFFKLGKKCFGRVSNFYQYQIPNPFGTGPYVYVFSMDNRLGDTDQYWLKDSPFWASEPQLMKWGDEDTVVTQTMAFPRCTLGEIMLYVLQGGTGTNGENGAWDGGWLGAGLQIPDRFIDRASFIGADSLVRDLLVLEAGTEVRKWLADELRVDQNIIVSRANWETNAPYRLTMLSSKLGQLFEASDAKPLNHNITLTIEDEGGVLDIDRSTQKIVNALEMQIGQSIVNNIFTYKITQRQWTSIDTYGQRRGNDLKVASLGIVGDYEGAVAVARRVAENYFSRFAFPYEVYMVGTASPYGWTIEVGDKVLLTNELIPAIDGDGKGVTNLFGVVQKVEPTYAGGKLTNKIVVLTRADATSKLVSAWSPSLQSVDYVTTKDVWTVAEHAYSNADDPADLSYFEIGDTLTCLVRGSTTATTRTIIGIDRALNQITLDSALTASYSGALVTFFARVYNFASTHQQQFCFRGKGFVAQ